MASTPPYRSLLDFGTSGWLTKPEAASCPAPDRPRATIAVLAALLVLGWQTAFAQVLAILLAGIAGRRFFETPQRRRRRTSQFRSVGAWPRPPSCCSSACSFCSRWYLR